MSEILNFSLSAERSSSDLSLATTHGATVKLDTSLAGYSEALTPIELLLSAQAACFIKGVERFAEELNFDFSNVIVSLSAQRPADQATITGLQYLVEIETPESEDRVGLIAKNLVKHGTIYNVLSAAIPMTGEIRKRAAA
ncbi:OsmC family protein [Aquiluna sp. KACHI24]|uniref:OsmC family protein n=1 Tax=Aquiluna sp. KACHI24 TaxID=2968831 RepID=UPI0022032E5E|nr:OsmC family protein [Aquiluna sp. KACHI24]BDQ00775.1 hypothetical protein AKACHI_11110 [Aquiluna sp. KACHI24]